MRQNDRGPVRWLHALNPIGHAPSDTLDMTLAALIQKSGDQRDRLTQGIYIPKGAKEPFRMLETAFTLTLESEAVASKVRKAIKQKKLKKGPSAQLYKDAVTQNVITQQEAEVITKAEAARWDAIQVDDYALPEYLGSK